MGKQSNKPTAVSQEQYNKDHGIIPKTIQKAVRDTIKASFVADVQEEYKLDKDVEIKEIISKMTDEMLKYAANMEFEKAAEIRDKIKELEKFYKSFRSFLPYQIHQPLNNFLLFLQAKFLKHLS